MQSESKLCVHCSPQAGLANGNWKGGKTKHHKGYIMVRVRNNKYVMEHIIVMEGHIGKELADGETIHHLNGIRDDNRIENLELWTKPQPAGIRHSDAVVWAKEILARDGACGKFDYMKGLSFV